jgi:tetratricopeptide (TPR) repeat protein
MHHTARLAVAATAALLTALLLGGRPAAADTVLLKDGRTVEAPKAEKQADGSWALKFKHGDIVLPADLVKEAWCVGAAGYLPKDDEEKAKLEKGLVPHEGKWIPKAERDQKVAKKTAEAKKRVEEARAHREWRNRYRDKTSNFEFEYTIPPEIAKGYMDLMETFFAVFTKEFKITKPREKLKVCFYHDYDTFIQVGGAYGALAYFKFVPPLELNFYYDRVRPEQTSAIMYHEVQHYLCHLLNPQFSMPHCFGEGLSEYYGGSTWDPVKKAMTTGGVQEGRLTEVHSDIAKGTRHPLQKYLNGELGYDDYTWGWTFVHFMMETPKYAKKFKTLYAALPNAKDIKRVSYGDPSWNMTSVDSAALNKAFKKYMDVEDIAALEKEWHEYIDTRLKVTSVVGFEEAAFSAYGNDQNIRAKRLFKEAVEKGSKNPAVYLRYGEMIKDSDAAEAERMFRKGLTFDPLRTNLWTALGRLVRKKDEAAGKQLILLAAEIDPDNVETWLLMEEALEKAGDEPAPGGG